MNDDVEARLRRALQAAASSAVGDERTPPRFDPDSLPRAERAGRRRTWLAPLLAAAAVAAVAAGGVTALQLGGQNRHAPPPAAASAPTPPRVHVSSPLHDGEVVGVGMPIVLRFSVAPTSAAAFDKAVTVTVNGRPAAGAWYWQQSGQPGVQVEARYRQSSYWPAHATIAMNAPVKALSAGGELRYDNDLSLRIATGASHVSTVDAATHTMTVTSDGKVVRRLPVSVGARATPTLRGVKVVMEKDRTHQMTAPEYPVKVDYAVRLTNSGEFVFAAPWDKQVGKANTSGGGTRMSVACAQWFYNFSRLGDVVSYPDASGKAVPSWDGYTGWNLPWPTWQAGGLLH